MKIIAIIGVITLCIMAAAVIIIMLAAAAIISQAINQAHSWEDWANQDDRKGKP